MSAAGRAVYRHLHFGGRAVPLLHGGKRLRGAVPRKSAAKGGRRAVHLSVCGLVTFGRWRHGAVAHGNAKRYVLCRVRSTRKTASRSRGIHRHLYRRRNAAGAQNGKGARRGQRYCAAGSAARRLRVLSLAGQLSKRHRPHRRDGGIRAEAIHPRAPLSGQTGNADVALRRRHSCRIVGKPRRAQLLGLVCRQRLHAARQRGLSRRYARRRRSGGSVRRLRGGSFLRSHQPARKPRLRRQRNAFPAQYGKRGVFLQMADCGGRNGGRKLFV